MLSSDPLTNQCSKDTEKVCGLSMWIKIALKNYFICMAIHREMIFLKEKSNEIKTHSTTLFPSPFWGGQNLHLK